MPLKPRELITETRAKDSKISPARHVLAPGAAALGLLTDVCWMEMRMCWGSALPHRSACFLGGTPCGCWCAVPCGYLAPSTVPLWPLQAVTRLQLQFSISWLLGVPLVLVLPWLTRALLMCQGKLCLLLRHQHFTSCWMGGFGSLLRAQLWEPKVLTSQCALSNDFTAWPCPRCSAFNFPSVEMGLWALGDPPLQDCLLTCRAVIFPIYCCFDLLHDLEWAAGCNDAKQTLPQADAQNIISPWNASSEEIPNTRILVHGYIFSLFPDLSLQSCCLQTAAALILHVSLYLRKFLPGVVLLFICTMFFHYNE